MNLLYPLNIKNKFVFNPSPRDFIVDEIPLYDFTGEGEHLVLHIRKKDMTTWEMIGAIARYLDIKQRDIGYAGLKDKNAMTMQYISLLAKDNEERLKDFNHEKIKILSTQRHNNKIRVGHLKGNHFKIRFKKVLGVQKDKLDSVLKWIKINGVPNYFGNQRFGNDGNNWEEGKALVEGKLKMRNRKTRTFLLNAYQSYLFNYWLSKRIELSLLLHEFSEEDAEKIFDLAEGSLKGTKEQKHFFKLLDGDLMMHYPFGRVFELESLAEESKRFVEKDIAPTGLLAGKRVSRATGIAREIEQNYDEEIGENGARRYAWIAVENIKSTYVQEKAQYELSFYLPKGSYATNVLDILRGGQEE
ncbi:tRNA pseudouridine(13) synthase TruD [Sulfurovum sp. bin170]|uniref:tRNA pseudouridine(13) synthase TruD n=1 Tax=Sulfurovum sp. bin170 TaxID=2695268 RepID=UPI0013DF8415|nr:tRNA pseudouridine(13) synthase TruD [Sulfurovum sp. bin170]NEW60765.1 tRNA pseudouridine(13) synthase TruD [Sulfurovum sp. bin170]